MDRYFYKIIDNIDFVWKIETVIDDPYKLNETDFGHYVCNERQFIPYLFNGIQDIAKRNLLTDYKEIKPRLLNEDNCYFDKYIGLLHKDNYWDTLFAIRYVNCLKRMAPIVFRDYITETDIRLYLKLINCDKIVGDKIYQTAYNYFKSLWEIDEFFSSTNLDTIEKFLKTIELQAIYIRRDDSVVENIANISFRPSWDEEHGLGIILNLDSMEVKLDE